MKKPARARRPQTVITQERLREVRGGVMTDKQQEQTIAVEGNGGSNP